MGKCLSQDDSKLQLLHGPVLAIPHAKFVQCGPPPNHDRVRARLIIQLWPLFI